MINYANRVLLLSLICFFSGCTLLDIANQQKNKVATYREVQEKPKVKNLLMQAKKSQENGNNKAAENSYEEMLEAGVKSSRSLNHYAVFLRQQFKLDKAEAMYHKAYKLSPSDPVVNYNLGIFYELYRGDFEKARDYYQRYMQLNKQSNKQVSAWVKDLNKRIAANGN